MWMWWVSLIMFRALYRLCGQRGLHGQDPILEFKIAKKEIRNQSVILTSTPWIISNQDIHIKLKLRIQMVRWWISYSISVWIKPTKTWLTLLFEQKKSILKNISFFSKKDFIDWFIRSVRFYLADHHFFPFSSIFLCS